MWRKGLSVKYWSMSDDKRFYANTGKATGESGQGQTVNGRVRYFEENVDPDYAQRRTSRHLHLCCDSTIHNPPTDPSRLEHLKATCGH